MNGSCGSRPCGSIRCRKQPSTGNDQRFLLAWPIAVDCVAEDQCGVICHYYFDWGEEDPDFGIEVEVASYGLPLWERLRDAWRLVIGQPKKTGSISIERDTLRAWIRRLQAILVRMESPVARYLPQPATLIAPDGQTFPATLVSAMLDGDGHWLLGVKDKHGNVYTFLRKQYIDSDGHDVFIEELKMKGESAVAETQKPESQGE